MHPICRPLALPVLLLSLCAKPGMAGEKLLINGKTATSDVRTIGGSPYVKLADVARALGMVVVKRSDGSYEITRPGGANQVQGVSQGKVGDVLFDGKWRFQVLSVQTPASYMMQTTVEPSSHPLDTIEYDRVSHVLKAKPGYKLVALQCRMANGQKTTQTFWLGHNEVNNALADTQGESHVPVGYDLEGAPIQSQPLLPGAKTDFILLFSVPTRTELKDLVFTLRNNDSSQKGNDVRVSLAGEKHD
jgi:hypothetical protein